MLYIIEAFEFKRFDILEVNRDIILLENILKLGLLWMVMEL